MAKLGKEKFNFGGHHQRGRTTYRGDVELQLYYDVSNNHFYFNQDELAKYLPAAKKLSHHTFRDCDTKEKAINLVKFQFATQTKKEKFLDIQLRMSPRIWGEKKKRKAHRWDNDWKGKPGLPTWFVDMMDSHTINEDDAGIRLGFRRIVIISSGDHKAYVEADENWEYSDEDVSQGEYREPLVPHTPEIEKFLIGTMSQLDALSNMIMNFFSAKDMKSLAERITLQAAKNNLLTFNFKANDKASK